MYQYENVLSSPLFNLSKKPWEKEHYYDFGTGNKVEVPKEKSVQSKASVTTPPKTKSTAEILQDAAFTEGFNYYEPKTEAAETKTDMWLPLSETRIDNGDEKDFLDGFNEGNETFKEQSPDEIEFGNNPEALKILKDLGSRWHGAEPQEQARLHEVAEEVRRLTRAGNMVRYGQDEIMELLHKNAQTATNYQKSLTNGFPGFLYRMSDDNYMLDSSTYLIGMTDNGDWDYKYDEHWQIPGKEYDGYNLLDEKSNYRNWLPWIYFDGYLIGADKLGNMNMSYVGKKMGMPEWVYKNFLTTDKDDAFWVQYGIDLADSGR